MSDKIVKKVENLPQLTAVKRTDKLIQRVAAYARVSTGKEEQQTSIVAQKEYYTDYIKSHAGWQFVGVYADEGISGCSTKRREQFKQLMSDCMAGKIEIFLRTLIQCPVNGSVENGLKQRLSADLDVLPKAFFFYASM